MKYTKWPLSLEILCSGCSKYPLQRTGSSTVKSTSVSDTLNICIFMLIINKIRGGINGQEEVFLLLNFSEFILTCGLESPS